MRIVCESCGKKYSTTSEPVPGKLYRLSCRGCGRPLAIRAPGEGEGPLVEIEVVPPISAATGTPAGQAAEAPRPPRLVRYPPFGRGAEAPPIAPRVEGEPALELPELPPEPGEAAAPDSGTIDLFAGETPEVPAPAAASPAVPMAVAGAEDAPRPSRTPGDPPRTAPSPAPARRRTPTAAVAVGLAAVALVALLALWRGGDGTTPRVPPAIPPAAGPGPAVAPAPAGEGPSTQGTTGQPASEAPAPAARPPRREPAGPAAPRPPRAVASRAAASGPARPAAPAPAQASAPAPRAAPPIAAATPSPAAPPIAEPGPEPLNALSPELIRDTIRAGQPARAACLGEAPAGTLDGRTVVVKVTVKPSGVVAYPTLDDAAIGGTGLGTCLKESARRMTFPRFKGEALRLEIPVALVH